MRPAGARAGRGRDAGLLVAGAVGGAVLALALSHLGGGPVEEAPEVRTGASGLVDPLLECRETAERQRAIAPFREDVNHQIATFVRDGRATRVSVYYRDLANGPWFAAGDAGVYRVGSLLKVPLLLGYLRRAEADPAILQKELAYAGGADREDVQNVVPGRTLEPGRRYTVWELLERAIVYSDNEAAALLAADDGGESLERIRRLVDFPPFEDGTLQLTPRHFAAMFRILYNASYLTADDSERALELLARVDFRDGLVAGVAPGVVVAHKFGERVESGTAKLHDCGIVYHPARPYLLCVMTEGRRLADLPGVVAGISRLSYEAVSRQTAAGGG